MQSSVANVIHAVAQYSPDVAKDIAVDLAPLVFLAMHGTVNEEGTLLYIHVYYIYLPNTVLLNSLYMCR